MSKLCVFITGTNAVGKTHLMKSLMSHYGGVAKTGRTITQLNDRRVCAAGSYEEGAKYGGVDRFNETKCLEGIVRSALKNHDIILCEGFYLHTFGLNLQRAAFVAQKQLVIFLYAPVAEIDRRLKERSGRGITECVWKTQLGTANAAKSWAKIGVPVICYDTSKNTVECMTGEIINKIESLWASGK